ncbi:tyrosine-type recombinase/integrase [Vibrio hyugaensis]|uniref:tyrosine-type recombinase/integrase n=1 Tax=Vibrio hyugaensis TaxID=1534743 RepID=UPI003DA008F1
MLTVKEIKGLKPKKTPYYTWDKSGERGKGRLGVQVMPSGAINFKFRYFKHSKSIFIQLGKMPGMSLALARDLCKEYGDLLSQGIDPKDELEKRAREKSQKEREASEIGSFEQLITLHAEHKKTEGKRSYQDEMKKIVDNVFPYLDIKRKAKDFKAEDFIHILSIPIESGHAAKSNKIRSILHAAFNFGRFYDNDPAYKNRNTKFGISGNPIADIPKQTWAEKAGTHFLSWEEVEKLLWDMDHRYTDLDFAFQTRQAIKLCFHLGGQRPYEVVTLEWSDINFKDKYLTVQQGNFKTNIPHVIPLTKTAINILQDLKSNATQDSPYVFYKKTNPLEHMPTNSIAQALLTYKSRTKEVRPFIGRDFRRTVKTLGATIKLSKEIRDRIQGHAFSDVSSKHYDMYEYLDEKRAALEIWEKELNERIEKFTQ